jgi:hypothetical protein
MSRPSRWKLRQLRPLQIPITTRRRTRGRVPRRILARVIRSFRMVIIFVSYVLVPLDLDVCVVVVPVVVTKSCRETFLPGERKTYLPIGCWSTEKLTSYSYSIVFTIAFYTNVQSKDSKQQYCKWMSLDSFAIFTTCIPSTWIQGNERQ